MEVFRIAKCEYINDLSGDGARLYGGRWNSKGIPVVYTSGSRPLCALEVLVHVPLKNITADYCIATIHIPEQVKIKELSANRLPADWQMLPFQADIQAIGDEWWQQGAYCVLKVPSVIIKEEWNYLINPRHPEAKKIRISDMAPFQFDKRLR